MAWLPAPTFFVSHRSGTLASAISIVVNFVNQLTALISKWQTCARDKKRSYSGNTLKPAFSQSGQALPQLNQLDRSLPQCERNSLLMSGYCFLGKRSRTEIF